jgi:Phosphopantetheine attachment site
MSELEPPRTRADLTRGLCEIWRRVLNVGQIGVDDNFFDAGGYSLLFVEMSRLIAEELHEQVSIVDLLRCPTVRAQVELMQQRHGGDPVAGQKRNEQRAGVVRLMQQRLLREAPGHE